MFNLKETSVVFVIFGVVSAALIYVYYRNTHVYNGNTNNVISHDLTIPTLDLSDVEMLRTDNETFIKLSSLVYKACTTSGFFYIKVATEVQDQMFKVLKASMAFFQLPIEEKLYLANDNASQIMISGRPIPGTGSGYRHFGRDPNFRLDTRESFVMGPNISENRPPNYSGSGITYWPSERTLPGWKDIVQNYSASLLNICIILRQLVAAALGLDGAFFDRPGLFDRSTWLLGINHYLGIPSNAHKGIFGIRPHADSGIFTLLLSDGKPGLQVCVNKSVSFKNRTWWNIPSPPRGCLIVNLGKNLERWTNGHFKATLHRVFLTGGEERYSVPFFYETNIDTLIKPIEKFCEGLHCKYNPVTAAELLLERLRKSDLDEDFE